MLRVPEYVKKLTVDGVDPRGRPRVVRDGGACLVVDGGNSMGQIGAQFAMAAGDRAGGTTGIAAAAIRGSNHCGAMAYYAMQALPHDMIGLATTNALPTMAPWGGAERRPRASTRSASRSRPARSARSSTTPRSAPRRTARSAIYQQKGLTLPEGWALDREGQPTTDPAAAIDGLLQPIGGFKGAGLAMIVGSSAPCSPAPPTAPSWAVWRTGPRRAGRPVRRRRRIASFTAPATFKGAWTPLSARCSARLAPGFDRIYAPGEREFLTRDDYLQNGIPLNDVTLADLRRAATDLGVDAV